MNETLLEVTWLDLDAGTRDAASGWDTLDPTETLRAKSFRAVRDRDRYVARHAWVRHELSRRLGVSPAGVPLMADPLGKPRLAHGALGFSVSHSNGLALMAVVAGGSVGCDIEWRDNTFPVIDCAARFFSAGEYGALVRLAPSRRIAGFYCGWTRKEAFLKATGEGLARPLNSFEVEVDPDRDARLGGGCEGWSVASFEPVPGFQAAVVARGAWSLRHLSS